jgi:AcrR family transcriptional regulator
VQRKPAHETLEKMLASAEEQLREEGFESFTVQGALQRSGLSVGAFYSRFPDKTAILRELQERVHGRMEPLIISGLGAMTGKTKSLQEAVDCGFGTLIDRVVGERELFRSFMMLSISDPEMRAKGEQVSVERRRALTALLLPHADEIGHPDVEAAIGSAYSIYTVTMRGRLIYYGSPFEAQFGPTDDSMFDDLKDALALYLRGPARPARGKGKSAATEKGSDK